MARVRPFRAITYARVGSDVTRITAPPYDVITPEQRTRLLSRDAHNIVALELAEGPLDPGIPGNRYETAGARWDAWLREGILVQEDPPAVYALEQRFEHSGRQVRRRALVAAVDLEPFDAGVVLPHERTLPRALSDRLAMLRSTRANLSQVLGTYSDPARTTDRFFDSAAAAAEPILTASDDDGVESAVWALTDRTQIAAIERSFADARLFIADGHHRYSVALTYRDERRAEGAPSPSAELACDSVMMALVNMDDPELVVLPTHRVADASGDFDAAAFFDGLAAHFSVEDVPSDRPESALDAAERPAFIVRTRGDDRLRLIRLKDGVDLDRAISTPASKAWKTLDVSVVQELVLRPLLNIYPDRPETLDRLRFVKDTRDALAMVPDHDVALILRATRIEQMREVALAGEMLPQKSTYFYPKLLSGLLMRSLD